MNRFIEYRITTNFDESVMFWAATKYTLKDVTNDLKKHCLENKTNIKDYRIERMIPKNIY